MIRFAAMGTTVAYQLVGVSPGAARAAAQSAAQSLIEQIESQLSRFRPDSDVSRLNRAAGTWTPVGDHTLAVLGAATELRQSTSGLFNPLAGALPLPGQPPTEPAAGSLQLDIAAGQARLDGPIDLGGIGKGYAADQLIQLARELGASAALASVGVSSISVFGERPSGGPWRIGLRAPGQPAKVSFGTMALDSGALATSGLDEQGQHIRDPRSGQAAQSEVAQATVTAASGMVAEAYSTALMVGGVPLAARLCGPGQAGCVLVTAESVLVSSNLRESFAAGAHS
jgi:thiamine biosynthesis lipoprotein